jgi:hypothetical protein
MAMAIHWRKKPEYHRRMVFIASCQLMDAAIGRFDFMLNHNLFYSALDSLIVLGMVRDWLVDKARPPGVCLCVAVLDRFAESCNLCLEGQSKMVAGDHPGDLGMATE